MRKRSKSFTKPSESNQIYDAYSLGRAISPKNH